MNYHRARFLTTSLAISVAIIGGTASASDHYIWREQVPRPVESVIVLESKAVDPKKKTGNDSLLWREQVKVISKNRVFVLERAPQRLSKSSDRRLWREQIKTVSPKPKQKMASNAEQTDKNSDQ